MIGLFHHAVRWCRVFLGVWGHRLAVGLLTFAATAASAQFGESFGPALLDGDATSAPLECHMRPSRTVAVTALRSNALSMARALSEAVAAGTLSPVAGERPAAADNSTLMYFPPVREQELGDCTCWSSGYYYNTYTQARDEELDAASDDPDVLCSPRFIFSLICLGDNGAECTEHVMSRLADVGCSSVALHPFDQDHRSWPSEAAWVQALVNRTATPHKIRADLWSGLEAIKQHIANGGCVVTRGIISNNLTLYPDAAATGIDNRVWYARADGLRSRHSVCIVGYDDERSYLDHRDGLVHSGAFLVVNSKGDDWGWYNSTESGSKGFFWIAYNMFLEREFGYYDTDSPYHDECYDNEEDPTAYYNDDRLRYRPRLYAVAGINHAERKRLTYTGGVGPAGAPAFTGPEALEQTGGWPDSITHDKRVAVDLTDGTILIEQDESKQVFVALTVDASADSSGTMTSAHFSEDIAGDGVYKVVASPDPVVTVPAGGTGYAEALILPEWSYVYVDDSNVTGPWDGSREHPHRTIQTAIDNAPAGSCVRVLPGTYREGIVMTLGVQVVGAGPHVTTINSGNTSEAVHADGIVGGFIEGFTIISGPDYFALRSIDSTLTVRDCVATASRSGFGGALSGSLHLANCIADGNDRAGVWDSGTAKLRIDNCTLVNNTLYGVGHWGAGDVVVGDSIVWNNGDDLAGSLGDYSVDYCDIGDGDFAGSNGNICQDPLFVPGLFHGYYLSQTAAGQGADSPCVNAGGGSAASLELDERTTRTDGADDAGAVDMGYHGTYPLWITDVYWDQSTTSVVLAFASQAGADYVVEAAQADAYSDGVMWTVAATVTAAGPETTIADDLAASPLTHAFRFYRVTRADESDTSRQTAGVFEARLQLTFPMRDFFISMPLVPDPDHASVQDVLGSQIDRTWPTVTRHVHASGLKDRMRYDDAVQTWSVLLGSAFDIEACRGYFLSCGPGVPELLRLRLTGYVPEEGQSVFVGKAGWAVADHWIAYSMPRPTTLDDLGLVAAVTPWNPWNLVQLRPFGSGLWTTYQYDTVGGYWYEVLSPGVPVNPPIACGEAVVFSRKSVVDTGDMLATPTWYGHPPNRW